MEDGRATSLGKLKRFWEKYDAQKDKAVGDFQTSKLLYVLMKTVCPEMINIGN